MGLLFVCWLLVFLFFIYFLKTFIAILNEVNATVNGVPNIGQCVQSYTQWVSSPVGVPRLM